jgi:hypothetical protein
MNEVKGEGLREYGKPEEKAYLLVCTRSTADLWVKRDVIKRVA